MTLRHVAFTFILCCQCAAQESAPIPGQAFATGLFQLKEMDLHLHAGMERPVRMDDWIDLAVKDGRKVLLLLDHLELYRKTPQEYEAWRSKGSFEARYPRGAAGHKTLFMDFDSVARRSGILVFKGWEVSETELDDGLEMEPLRMVDVIGWHISPRNGFAPPDGQTLLRRVRQIRELQKQLPIPMILFHPFHMRFENLQRTAKAKGQDARSITAEQYRFFHGNEQQELIGLLKGSSIYIEMSRGTDEYFDDPACRAALAADILPLARGGVQFTVSTDNHHVRAASQPFNPARYSEPLGVNPLNTNTIVRELLAIRARRLLDHTRRP